MSERISDEELDRMDPAGNSRYISVRADRWTLVLTELKQRRAQDLTALDIDALKWARSCVEDELETLPKAPKLPATRSRYEQALAALDRLLARTGGDET